MPKIIFLPHDELCPEGAVIENIKSGESICDVANENDIFIEHSCEKSCACTTCHIHIREGGESLNEADELEDDMLDKAWGLDMDSRLSCQTILADKDLVVEIPKHTINMVSEAK
ncbi:MAG: ISC system 2Fe-2S type ferredoxin [Gammaproteobacteria bacterium]|nr:MAG: ISC system 2Fe-2S type ferredoxin [Gammaproteobacteria bacterium]